MGRQMMAYVKPWILLKCFRSCRKERVGFLAERICASAPAVGTVGSSGDDQWTQRQASPPGRLIAKTFVPSASSAGISSGITQGVPVLTIPNERQGRALPADAQRRVEPKIHRHFAATAVALRNRERDSLLSLLRDQMIVKPNNLILSDRNCFVISGCQAAGW